MSNKGKGRTYQQIYIMGEERSIARNHWKYEMIILSYTCQGGRKVARELVLFTRDCGEYIKRR